MDMVALDLRVEGQAVEEDLLFSPVSLAALVPLDADGDGAWSQRDLDAQLPALFLVTFGQAPLTADGVPCTLSPLSAEPDGGAIRLRARGTCPEGGRKLRQKLGFLSSLAEGHRVVVQANLDGVRHDGVADRATQVLVWEREAPRGLAQFVALGVEHIFTGYDHLLFLLGLLLAGGTVRRLLVVVSCFTLAHSATLALAALSVVTLPSRLVESAIAGSIIFVAAENFLVKEPRRRGLLAFSFGLVHGFGFASVLADMHLARQGVLRALFGFNLGVELGQGALVLAVAPLLAVLRRREWFARTAVPAICLGSLCAGAYWLVERALLGE
jgi:hydrogenase/urease accessory protein HupE